MSITHSFCEPVTASPRSRWHIRQLTSAGRKTTGGVDTKSLCGREMAWDLSNPVAQEGLESKIIDYICLECQERYKETTE